MRTTYRTPDGDMTEIMVSPKADAPTLTEKIIKDFKEDFKKYKHLFPEIVGYDGSLYQQQKKELGEKGIMCVIIEPPGLHSFVGAFNGILEAATYAFYDYPEQKVVGDCQTSLACALYMGLVNDDEKPKVMEQLVEQIELHDFHIDCGILGTKYIMHALNDMGRADLAYTIATQTTFPSWGYWIEQGATTLWETWNGNSSRNHHMFSDISAWFYKGLAGINPDPAEPGFKHIILRPNPVAGLNWVRAKHRSMYGEIECNWETTGDELRIAITVPVNCHATLYIPKGYLKDIAEKGGTADGISAYKKYIVQDALHIVSGQYRFVFKKSKIKDRSYERIT